MCFSILMLLLFLFQLRIVIQPATMWEKSERTTTRRKNRLNKVFLVIWSLVSPNAPFYTRYVHRIYTYGSIPYFFFRFLFHAHTHTHTHSSIHFLEGVRHPQPLVSIVARLGLFCAKMFVNIKFHIRKNSSNFRGKTFDSYRPPKNTIIQYPTFYHPLIADTVLLWFWKWNDGWFIKTKKFEQKMIIIGLFCWFSSFHLQFLG